ncbi:hypothetical protein [Kordiimonas lacus]|uniref:Uncharacterized protein n=1 Tax=Kordiimonas lacus TaxID=637679 RepID=A0A1G7D7U8_9PROT|nr:hypothetical protein [Kordiimonas lacus]SDE47601.1 hypothetical protein SAMN04488071_2994 [Kordiimonas lacus]
MLQIFKSEFQRYRLWAILATVGLLAIYVFVAKLMPFLQGNSPFKSMLYLGLLPLSALFGFVQMMLHRRTNHWTYLIHRPLAPRNIYFGLALAGAAVVSMVVLVPWFIMVGGMDAFSGSVVDTRHYGYGFFLLFCSLAAYFVGTLAAISANKGAILLAIFLNWMMTTEPESTFLQFFPMLVILGILVTLNVVSFKPDLSTHERRPWAITLTVFPMTYALLFGLSLFTTVYYHVPKFIMGTHPDLNPVEGTVSYMWELGPAEQVAYALEGSSHPKTDYYIKQAELADMAYLDSREWSYPTEDQLHTLDIQHALAPTGTNSIWKFAHDEMLMIGMSEATRKPIGAIGVNGFIDDASLATAADRFQAVPVMVGKKFLMTNNRMYQLDFAERSMDIKHELPAGERYVAKPQIRDDYVAILTDKRTLLFDPKVLRDGFDRAVPEYSIDHPASLSSFHFVDTYRLVDGYLMLYRGNHFFGFNKPGSAVVHAKLGGAAETIHERHYELKRHPSWIQYHFEMMSPAMVLIDHLYRSKLMNSRIDNIRPDGDLVLNALLGRQHPPLIYWMAGILMTVSAAAALIMSRKHGLGRAQTATWVALCAIFSLPALISFFLMNPWRTNPKQA